MSTARTGRTGAKIAAEALGLEVVYDGEGAVVPGADQTPVITELVDVERRHRVGDDEPDDAGRDPRRRVRAGPRGPCGRATRRSWNYQLLGTDLGPILDEVYTHSTYTALWDAVDVAGHERDDRRACGRSGPTRRRRRDVYILGWTEGYITQQILEQAAANGDMTRAGVVAAANEVTVDLKGLAPDQTWAGEPNDFIVRESYMYDVDSLQLRRRRRCRDEDAGTGFTLDRGPVRRATSPRTTTSRKPASLG